MTSVNQRTDASLTENLALIAEAARMGVDLATTPFALTVPLEVERLVAILAEGGLALEAPALPGLQSAAGLYEQLETHTAALETAIQRILADKRATMRTTEGRKLTADELWRAFEFFNEVARTVQIVINQKALDSPAQHPHPGVGQVSAKVGPTRKK